MTYFADNLRYYRKKLGLTQEDVAQAVFVAPQSVSKWERGETTPDMDLLPALAMLLGISVDALLGVEKIHADAAKREIFRIAHERYDCGDYASAAQVHREGLRRFPGDAGMLSELALSLAMIPGGLEEAAEICEKTLSGGCPDKIGHTVRAALCLIYNMKGDSDAAVRLAGTLPHVRESREEILVTLQRGSVPGENERYLRYLTLGKM